MVKNKFKMLAVAVSMVLGSTVAMADSFAELERESKRANQTQQEKIQKFHQWLDSYLTEYESWRDEYTANLDKEREVLIDQWGSGEVPDATKAVEYSNDSEVKKVVDYENNEATVSILVDAGESTEDALAKVSTLDIEGLTLELADASKSVEVIDYSPEQEKKEKQFIIDHIEAQMRELDIQAERLINAKTGIPDSFIYERAHSKKVALIQSAAPRISAISEQFTAKRKELGIAEPLKAPTTEVEQKKPVAQKPAAEGPKSPKSTADKVEDKLLIASKVEKEKSVDSLSPTEKEIQSKPVAEKPTEKKAENPSKVEQVANAPAVKAPKKVVSYKVKLPENSLKARASKYQSLVEKESERWDIEAPLIMAIMHSESSFRPEAKSHVPAYGLMQVVPTSAGHDVNKQFRKIDAPMKPNDLYVPPINVETGAAYLNILEKRYLKSITNEESRMYAVIAAYNTGAGNVAKAFNKDRSTNIRKAAVIINSMTPDEVYEHLVKNLPYDETKNYLQKVNGRIALYQ